MPINPDPNELERRLRAEGFRRTYVWQDGPDTFYADHTHAVDTAHIILDGGNDTNLRWKFADLQSL